MGTTAVTYKAPHGDNKVVELHGLTFFDGQTQKLDDEEHAAFLDKARNNPHFLVGDEQHKESGGKPGRQQRQTRQPRETGSGSGEVGGNNPATSASFPGAGGGEGAK